LISLFPIDTIGHGSAFVPAFSPGKAGIFLQSQPTRRSCKMKVSANTRLAFTLIELLVVIAVIGVLAGIAFPAVQSVREQARGAECLNRLRQVGVAIKSFEACRKHFPAGINPYNFGEWRSSTWLTRILPFVEQDALWNQATSDYQADPSPFRSHLGMRTVVELYQCPSDPDSAKLSWTHGGRLVTTTSYVGVNGTNYRERDGVFFLDSRIRINDIQDGLSQTLLVGERPPSPDFWYGWWYAGHGQSGSGSPDMILGVRELNDPPPPGVTNYLESCPPGPWQFSEGTRGNQCDVLHFWSYHPGGAHFLFCDGHIRLMSYDANEIMPGLATRNGDEVITGDF
jgi:prepilin-type N-terminal cleavage/methylation domain-containing protein/prepilin-type processing-associated H-X9-DG protein